jgi:hypothetical protein
MDELSRRAHHLSWGALEAAPETDYHWSIGDLRLWVRASGDEWLVAAEQEGGDNEVVEPVEAGRIEKPAELPWVRYIAGEETRRLRLLPCMPDHSVVVGSDTLVNILPQSSGLFHVGVPVWVRVVIGRKERTVLAEFPSLQLSNTWFGDPMSGELCYSLRSRARRALRELETSPHRAVCPVRVFNRSPRQVDFQKMCVHVERLRVYRSPTRLWTNEVRIEIIGDDQVSQVAFSRKAPEIEQGCDLLTGERIPSERGLLQKGVSILKSFTSM